MLSTFIKRYVVSTSAMMLLEGYSSLDSKHPKRGRTTVFGPLLDVTVFLGLFFLVGWCCGQQRPGGLKATDLCGSDSDAKHLTSIFPMHAVYVIYC